MLSLHDSLRKINEGLARIREFRPLWKDEYSANPVLTPEEIVAFEEKHSCRLPEAYREFLLHVGNGGAGPVWGLSRLGQHFSDYDNIHDEEESFEDDADLSKPFPHKQAWNDEDCPDDDAYFGDKHVAGSMIIADRGCNLSTRLIITGPCAGEIWDDDRPDREGIQPQIAPDGSRYQFLPWYMDWLARRVHQYGHKGNPNPDPGPGGATLAF
jgi:hypothetical protein